MIFQRPYHIWLKFVQETDSVISLFLYKLSSDSCSDIKRAYIPIYIWIIHDMNGKWKSHVKFIVSY